MVSSIEQQEFSSSSNNIFQSASTNDETVLSPPPSPSSDTLFTTTSPPSPDKSGSWKFVPSIHDDDIHEDVQDQPRTTSSRTQEDAGGSIGALGVLTYALLALVVICITSWMYLWYRHRQYRREIEDTRQAMVRRRKRRWHRSYSNPPRPEQPFRLTWLNDIFEYHAEQEGVIVGTGQEEEMEVEPEMMEQEQDHHHNSSTTDSTRYEEIVKRFYFQTVLSDNDATPCSHDEENPKEKVDLDGDDASSTTTSSTTNGDSNSEEEQEEPKERRSSASDWFQSWRKTVASPPKQQQCCCICLEDYWKGETICVPITKRCNHVFHEECMVAWLQKHNDCPLCRVDLMANDDDDANHEAEGDDTST